jgi:hypothetical protein
LPARSAGNAPRRFLPLYAYIDADDRHHEPRCDLLETHRGPLVVPALTIAEVPYLVGTRLGAVARCASSAILPAPHSLSSPSSPAIGYGLPISFGSTAIFRSVRSTPRSSLPPSGSERARSQTLDRHHSTVVQPSHAPAFALLPKTRCRPGAANLPLVGELTHAARPLCRQLARS